MKHFERKAIKKAEQLGQNSNSSDIEKIDANLGKMNKSIVGKIWDKVLFLWEQAKSPEVPLRLKLTIIGALLYLILPIDVIPDSLPGLGYIDDVSVLLWVFKEVSNYVVPKAVDKIKREVEESYFKKIDEKLKEIFKKYIVYSSIFFVLNVLGCLSLALKPFGQDISKIIAFGIFAVTFVWSIARFINYCHKHGKITVEVIKAVLKYKSLKKGIEEIIVKKYPVITKVYAGIEIAQQFIPGLDTVPDLEEIVEDFINHYKKMAVITVVIIVVYSLLIFSMKLFV